MDYIKDPGLNLLHISADSLFQTPWEIHPHALTADFKKYKESVLWAPYCVHHKGKYYMYVCAGSQGGAHVVLEVAVGDDSFHLAWDCARPNAIVTIVALYDKPQLLPLPDMYGKNLVFKTGGVDGCDCNEILMLIEEGKIDTTPLITHRFPLNEIEEAYRIFENKLDGVIKVAISGNK